MPNKTKYFMDSSSGPVCGAAQESKAVAHSNGVPLDATQSMPKRAKRYSCTFCKTRLSLAYVQAFQCTTCNHTWCNGCKIKHDCRKQKDIQDTFALAEKLLKDKTCSTKVEKL